ncbi:TIGR04084 family radical SAM/SPASM domain-containing protein [Archaeoglobus veneficus]|uniref:Radical SAM domain protein n=1 Tax=Archaeoglobus veneficus (strain DSM 11195 / SNP6) TaxID=693661 RepID=F2KSS0_ARCVS|nr:TIGR04084 family radical SAM/SPASM domain-containing protein [Archaeoglobus veneficus]AEA46965.1 Radical SAM domain protein [Archaeoglobus veneficus SNP6]
MLYIVFLTARCNLVCRYCGGSIDESVMPPEPTYSIEELRRFVENDPHPIIAFYGGEPLLRIDLLEKIMDNIYAEHYVLQTNGLLLDRLKEEHLSRLSTILVSIDGIKEVTDFYKGRVYDRVMENVAMIRKRYSGELIARMVACEKTDIFRDVVHLLQHFDYAHWQLNAVWSPDGLWSDFGGWVRKYNAGITRLVDFWLESMKKGTVEGIVPFLGVLKALMFEPNTSPPCGAGTNAFAITTDGRVVACPICADFEWNVLGTLQDDVFGLPRVEILEPCKSCELKSVCGGRCLFFNRERLWGDEGFNLVCSTARHLIHEIMKVRQEIEELVDTGVIDASDLFYPKYNNTTEIIP